MARYEVLRPVRCEDQFELHVVKNYEIVAYSNLDHLAGRGKIRKEGYWFSPDPIVCEFSSVP